MASPDPIQPVIEAMTGVLKAGKRVFIVGGINFPPKGSRPLVLTPAPYSQYGWNELAYSASWSQQVGYFLQQHATKGGMVSLQDPGPVNSLERLEVLVFQGWR